MSITESMNTAHDALTDALNAYSVNGTGADWFTFALLKTIQTRNITINDWNTLVDYVKHLSSDSVAFKEFAEDIATVITTDIVNKLDTVDATLTTHTSEIADLDATKSDIGHDHNDLYYLKTAVDNALALKSNTTHNHDTSYYTKSEVNTIATGKADVIHNHNTLYYAKSEVDALIDAVGVEDNEVTLEKLSANLRATLQSLEATAASSFSKQIVDELPTTGISAITIYLVSKSTDNIEQSDIYNEYIYIGDPTQPYDVTKWELLGNTNIDLTDYYTADEIDTLLANYTQTSSLRQVPTGGATGDVLVKSSAVDGAVNWGVRAKPGVAGKIILNRNNWTLASNRYRQFVTLPSLGSYDSIVFTPITIEDRNYASQVAMTVSRSGTLCTFYGDWAQDAEIEFNYFITRGEPSEYIVTKYLTGVTAGGGAATVTEDNTNLVVFTVTALTNFALPDTIYVSGIPSDKVIWDSATGSLTISEAYSDVGITITGVRTAWAVTVTPTDIVASANNPTAVNITGNTVFTFTPAVGHTLPGEMQDEFVINANIVSWVTNDDIGTLTINNPTGNVEINIAGE